MIMNKNIIKHCVEQYIKRKATDEELSLLFGNEDAFDHIMSSSFSARLTGQFIEYLRQEYLHAEGWKQLDKYLKVVSDFKYAGKDRADIRAFKDYGEGNIEIRLETAKIRKGKSLSVSNSELEGTLLEALAVRNTYFGNPDARIIIGVLSPGGVTSDVHAWFNGKKLQHKLDKLEVYGEEDFKKWWYYLAVIYSRQNWQYRLFTDTETTITYRYHQERLQHRWVPAMVNGKLKLLIVWGCRSGKTFGSLGLMKAFADKLDKPLRICIVTAIPSLFDDWTESIKTIFGSSAIVHRHRSGEKPPKTNKHLIILSSSQMLNPEDPKLGVDKKTNKAVMYKENFDVLVYDEGHQGLTAETTYKQVIKKIKHTHLIGLTATPFRNGLLNDSIFEDRDVFDYWDQIRMKVMGHPDYINVPERYLIKVIPTKKTIKLFKEYDLLEMGANLNSIYEDAGQMDAAIAIIEEAVFRNTNLLGDSNKHKIKDIIIRANSVEGSKTLLTALRNYTHRLTQQGLDDHLFGLTTGEFTDLPGVPVSSKISSDAFKKSVTAFFKQHVEGKKRKVLIVVGQGIVGHTFETVNTTIDLTTGISLIAKYQFWERGGTSYVYPDGYGKNTYYHFDLDPFRLYEMGQEMLNTKRADKSQHKPTLEKEYFELLNLFEITGGVSCEIVNQIAFKEKMNQMISTGKLSKLIPNPNILIVTDGTFNEYGVSKLKNGFGATGFGEDDHDDDLNKSAASKRKTSSQNNRKPVANLDKSTINAVNRLSNALPMMVISREIARRRNTLTN
jgi:hypothetical protein